MQELAPTFEPLADPPRLQYWLLESPLVPIAALLVAALVAWLLGRHSSRRRETRILSLGLLALAAGLYALSSLVRTPREAAIAATRELFVGLAEADPQLVAGRLAPEAIARVPGGYAPDLSREDLLGHVRDARSAAGRYSGSGWTATINSYRIRKLRAEAGEGRATTQINVVFTLGEDGVPRGTWWEVSLSRAEDDRWLAREIELLWVAGVPGWGRAR